MKIAFIAGLSDAKLKQKLIPLSAVNFVEKIDLYRKLPVDNVDKVNWKKLPAWIAKISILGEVFRFFLLFINGYKYDVYIGCFQQFHGIWSHIVARFWGKPVIQLVITSIEWNQKRKLCYYVMMHSDACGVRGEISVEKLKELGYSKGVVPINNLSDKRVCFSQQGISDNKKYDIISVANYADEKDFPWMLQLIKEIVPEKKDMKVLLCGKGLEENLGSIVNDLGLNENITFAGYLNEEELADSYTASKWFLLTSHTEGLPQVAIEAMSHGVPCVLTDVGECSWLIEDGVSGAIIEHGNTDKALDKISSLIIDDEKYVTMGIEARKRFDSIKEDFTLGKISENWECLLNSVKWSRKGGKRAEKK